MKATGAKLPSVLMWQNFAASVLCSTHDFAEISRKHDGGMTEDGNG
jgi:hypothetical protein